MIIKKCVYEIIIVRESAGRHAGKGLAYSILLAKDLSSICSVAQWFYLSLSAMGYDNPIRQIYLTQICTHELIYKSSPYLELFGKH